MLLDKYINRRIKKLIIVFFIAILINLFIRTYLSYQHHFSFYYTPENTGLYMNGECLAYCNPNDIENPRLRIVLDQMPAKKNELGFLQGIRNPVIKNMDENKVISLPYLEKSFDTTRFMPINVDLSILQISKFVLEFDLIMPVIFKIFLNDIKTNSHISCVANIPLGSFQFFTPGEPNPQQRFFVPKKLHKMVRTQFFFQTVSGITLATIYMGILLVIREIIR